MTRTKKPKVRNTPSTQRGKGDEYGRGVKNPQGKIRKWSSPR